MRIKFLPAIIILILFKIEFVNSQTYHFTVASKPYVDLVGGTPLVSAIWDDPELTIPIGFDFQYYGETIQTLYLPGTFSLVTLIDDPSANIISNIILFGADLIDRGYIAGTLLSLISYKTVGNPGNRVLTVEWKNAGFLGDLSAFGVSSDFINFQMKLYEVDGNIEFHYGPSSITHPAEDYGSGGPIIGLLESLDYINDINLGEIILLAGNPANPTLINTYQETHLNGSIPSGTSYTFSRSSTAVPDIAKSESKSIYFPNPCNDYVTLRPEFREKVISPVSIMNTTGQVVRMDFQPGKIEFDNLPAGVYQLFFRTSAGQVTQKIIVHNGE